MGSERGSYANVAKDITRSHFHTPQIVKKVNYIRVLLSAPYNGILWINMQYIIMDSYTSFWVPYLGWELNQSCWALWYWKVLTLTFCLTFAHDIDQIFLKHIPQQVSEPDIAECDEEKYIYRTQ